MNTSRYAASGLLVSLMLTLHVNVAAQDAGTMEPVSFSMPSGQVQMKFRFCPSGTVRPGMPDPIAVAQSTSPVSVRGFYIGETEVTVGQFRSVVGEDGIRPLVQLAAAEEKNKPEYRRAIQSGSEEPALFVGLDDAVHFCQMIQRSYDQARLAGTEVSVETRQFRLPGYVEWVYAARAIGSADVQPEIRHFNRWPTLSQFTQANQQKCQEVWSSLGKTGQFPGSQDDFLLLSSVTSAGEAQKVREVLEEAFYLAFKSEKRTSAGIGVLRPVGSTLPNDWNIFDMHESVTEWTMWASTADPRDIWERLTSRSELEGYENSFLSGGSFNDSYFGPGSLNRFTFWGGSKLTDGKPNPFPYSREIVEDKVPGFRVVMERTLAKDWLYLVRKNVLQGDQPPGGAKTHLADSERLVRELTPSAGPELKIVVFYKLLADPSAPRSDVAAQLMAIAEIQSSTDSQASASSAAANKLNALLKKKTTDEPVKSNSPTETDDQAYFRYFASRI